MCGIAGIIGKGPPSGQTIRRMVAAQAHRGPDDYGVWVDDAAGVAFGHNRLSIIDLSPHGHQPMTDGAGLWLVFNGEIYNYRELRAELTDYAFRSQSDSEVILAAWRRWGPDCLKRFIGMFALAIWDEHSRRLFCARDRLGIKPFLYTWQNGRLLFASEAKAILAAGVQAEPDMTSLADYLVDGLYDHNDRTFFAGIRSLPAGHSATLVDGRWEISSYWDLAAAADEPLSLSDDAAADGLMELFGDSVRLRLRSDVPLGINLSGGLDSSMLIVVADRLFGSGDGHIETFTSTFGDPRYDEDFFADTIPRRNHWNRHKVHCSPEECWDMIAPGLWHQEAPFGGVATVVYHKLHAEARARGIVVLLEAQGADEILAGYSYFRPHFWRELLESGQTGELRKEVRALPMAERASWLAKTRQLIDEGRLSVHYDGTQHLGRQGVIGDLAQSVSGAAPAPPVKSHLSAALWRDLKYSKLPRVLRMNDRLSMASSTELREPFLDHRVVEYAFRLPSHQKIRLGAGKFLQRHALRGVLPDAARISPKRMVVTPQREWFRGPLAARAEELLNSSSFASRGLFDAVVARETYRRFREGEGDNSFFIWQWVNIELWFRTFIDPGSKLSFKTLDMAYRDLNPRPALQQSA